MDISTDFKRITPNFNIPKGGYEWWYFDGQSEDGKYSFSIIIYHINPFSAKYIKEIDNSNVQLKKHPAVSISIYHKTKTVYYSFLEFDEDVFAWDHEKLTLNIENHAVSYSLTENVLKIDIGLCQKLASGHEINVRIKGKGKFPASNLIHSDNNARHLWHLVLPAMDINVDLNLIGKRGKEKINFQGIGYHDHNTGFEPMKDSFKDWYWGRYHFGAFTLIYYLMQKHEEQQLKGWLIDADNKSVLEHFEGANTDFYFRNVFGLKSARKIELIGNKTLVTVQCSHNVDNGPFYQRFIGESILKYKDQVFAAQGISEYIRPENIHKMRYWPLVHMRLRYTNQQPNWVQKSKFLYPWTW